MKIGIGLPNQVRNAKSEIIPYWAAQAEQAGSMTLATVGRIAYPGVMDTVALAAAAACTRSAELLSAVLLGPVWPPVLLAKEAAGIDAISCGRLTLGLGIGSRADDFIAEVRVMAGRGKRFDQDLRVYQRVWKGEPIVGGSNAAVAPDAREIPLLFGGHTAASLERMARWGTGYIGGSLPAAMVAPSFKAARAAWDKVGHQTPPRLVALAYVALGDADQGRSNVWDFYSPLGEEFAGLVTSGIATGPDAVREALTAFADIGATDLIFNPAVGDLDEITRLADIVL
jgi:alkanesulfonate monooxygenase SsuD/methylene tetrahydromethanopterin reductase-like flavin-dependent oxidoreductase (luciferase family)